MLGSDHVQAQPLKFILVVEKCSLIRSWEDSVQTWDLYTDTLGCVPARFLWAGVTNPVMAQYLVSLLLLEPTRHICN